MAVELHDHSMRRSATRTWPSQSAASARLCRPYLRLVDTGPEIRRETSAVLSLAALSVDDGEIAVDGLLDSIAAGTTLDVNGIPISIRPSGDFSTALDLDGRKSLVVTIRIPLIARVGE
jgi:hypothetical protein